MNSASRISAKPSAWKAAAMSELLVKVPDPMEGWSMRSEPTYRPATTAEIMEAHPKCGECNRRQHDDGDGLGGWCSWLDVPTHADFYCRHWEGKE